MEAFSMAAGRANRVNVGATKVILERTLSYERVMYLR